MKCYSLIATSLLLISVFLNIAGAKGACETENDMLRACLEAEGSFTEYTPDQANECVSCVASSIPGNATDCDDYEQKLCSDIDQCQCLVSDELSETLFLGCTNYYRAYTDCARKDADPNTANCNVDCSGGLAKTVFFSVAMVGISSVVFNVSAALSS